jgi:hypothetical protein
MLAWIVNSVEPSIGIHLAKFQTAKETGDYLNGLYVQSNEAKCDRLEIDSRAERKRDRSIIEFDSVMTGYWNQLAMMEPQFPGE